MYLVIRYTNANKNWYNEWFENTTEIVHMKNVWYKHFASMQLSWERLI